MAGTANLTRTPKRQHIQTQHKSGPNKQQHNQNTYAKRQDIQTEPGFVTFYDIWPGNWDQLKGSVKEPNKFHIYKTEKITRKASDMAEYIELFGSFTRDHHARRI